MAKSKFNLAEKLGAPVSNLNTPAMQIVEIPLDKLLDNEGNFFKVEDVQELVDDIEMRGLENPLTVCEAENGYYRIVAGHRRRKALEQIGKLSAPCFVKAYADADSEEVALIQSNLTARELTYYEKMLAVVRLEEALRRMKENGTELPGRLRDHLAEKSGESASAVHRMTYIYKHLSPELMEGLRQEKINESIAYELASSPNEVQTEFEQRLARGETVRAQDVKAARDKPTVSDGVVDAFLLRHIAQGHEAALYRVLHDSQFMTVKWLIEEVKDALFFRGYMGHDSEGAQYVLTISGLEVKRPFQGKLTWPQIVQRLRGMVESGKIAPPDDAPADEPAPEAQALRQLDGQMRQAVQEPQPAAPSIPEAPDTIIIAGKETGLPCAAWFPPDVQPPDGAHIIAQDTDNWYDEGIFAGSVLKNTRLLWREVVRWTLHPDDEAYIEPVQQPGPIWHPYPAETPDEGQTVLVCKEHSESGRSYSALLYRDDCWYLPELPDIQMRVDVRWWSAELAPESEDGE